MKDVDINQMGWENLRDEVTKLRTAIRYHRDQQGDERCHLDDDKLYEVLPEETPIKPRKLPCNFLENCAQFYKKRQNVEYTSVDDLYKGWDKDKPYLSAAAIGATIAMLKQASEDFSNDSCNEFPLKNTDENWEFFLRYLDYMNDDDSDDRIRPGQHQSLYVIDWQLCNFLVGELEKLLS